MAKKIDYNGQQVNPVDLSDEDLLIATKEYVSKNNKKKSKENRLKRFGVLNTDCASLLAEFKIRGLSFHDLRKELDTIRLGEIESEISALTFEKRNIELRKKR